MSRVGKAVISLPSGVRIRVEGKKVEVVGPKGQLVHFLPLGVQMKLESQHVHVIQDPDSGLESKQLSALHGLTRAVIANLVQGVSVGFTRELDIVGVGYRASVSGQVLNLIVGYSHPIEYRLPSGITAKIENNTHIVLSGTDKQLLGQVAAEIRAFRAPEPYQGKGIKYTDEVIVRKLGKAAGAK